MTVTTMPPAEAAAAAPTRSRTKLVLLAVALVAAGAAAYWFWLKPAGPTPPPEPGEVVAMEPIQVNLAEGHYLRLGMALQLTTTVSHSADGSKALDLAITAFTGRSIEALADRKQLAAIKAELLADIEEAYHGDVMDVYYTEFVTQ